MERGEFSIGMEFWTGTGRWRVTDVGTRTVVAIRVDRAEMTPPPRRPAGDTHVD